MELAAESGALLRLEEYSSRSKAFHSGVSTETEYGLLPAQNGGQGPK